MRFSRVLLVNPYYKGRFPPFLPGGLAYIAEALKNEGVEYDFVNMGLDKSMHNLRKRISSFSPNLVGVQMMTFQHKQTYNLIRKIKDMFPDLPIVVGGPHVSTMRTVVLEENECIDYGIVLEGEKTIVELVRGDLPILEIKGLIFRQGSGIRYTGDREFIEDLDSIPFPRYEKFDLQKIPTTSIPIVSSRGCPYDCTYCPSKTAIGKKLRVRTAENVVDEIQYWYRRGYKSFDFYDDNFTFYKQRVYEICDEIERRGLTDLKLKCDNGIRADRVDRELLARMKQVGFVWLSFGVESGNDRILKNLKKGEKLEAIERTIKDACELGFEVELLFMIGSPGETEAEVHDSIELALKYHPIANVNFYTLIPFPGTELFEWVKEHNYFLRSPDEYLNECPHWINDPVFETPEFPREARRRAFETCKQVTLKIRKEYMKRKMARYGVLAGILGYFYASEFVQWRILTSAILRRWIKKIFLSGD